MTIEKSLTRRNFVKQGAAATGAGMALPAILPASAKGANERVQMASIGMGGKGRHGMSIFHHMDDVDLVAACDVYEPHLREAVGVTGGKASAYRDFREIIAREDIDAVHISTPDHWHAIPTIAACEAGKDVFVEKPLSLTVAEGRRMVDAARKNGCVVQCGTQQRSGTHFQKAVELVAGGAIGEVTMVKTWNYGNDTPEGIGTPENADPPDELDWDFWLGPAPDHPYNPNRFRRFRWFWDHSGGIVTDWGVHLMDIVHWAMGVDAPLTVSATGGKYFLKDNRETPDTVHVTWEYPGFLATYTNRVCNGYSENGHGYGIQFHGTDATLYLNREKWELIPEERNGKAQVPPQSSGGSDQNGPHERQFVDCIRTRDTPVSDIGVTHRSTSACLIANIALRTGQKLEWDASEERFRNGEEANRLLDYEYRDPWKIG